MQRQRRVWSILPWVLSVCLVCWLIGAARADEPTGEETPVAAVIPFGAPQPAQAQHMTAACEEALGRIKGLQVIKGAQWDKEARESGQGDDLEAMARRLDADVLVTGTLSKGRDGWVLALDLFDDHLNSLGNIKLDLYQPQIGPAASLRLEDELARVIRPAVGLLETPPLPPSEPEPVPQDADKEHPDSLPPLESLHPQEAPPPPRPVRPVWRSIFDASVAVILSGRTLSCDPASLQRRNLPCDGAIFPLDGGGGLRLDGTFRPLELVSGAHPALAGLGLGLLLEVPFYRDRVQQDLRGNTLASYPTRELRAEVGLRWRWKLGPALRVPLLLAGLQYGYHSLSMSGGAAAPPYPDSVYQYVLPTLGAGVYLTPRLALRLTVGALLVLTGGPMTEAVTQSNQNPFGGGSAWGVRAALEGQLALPYHLSLQMGGRFERVALTFDGNGCTKSQSYLTQCELPAKVTPVQSATDLSLGLWLGLGYEY